MNSSTSVGFVPLDPWDELFHSLYTQYDGAGCGVAVLHMRGRIDPKPLHAALATLQERHPKLRARVVDSSDGRHGFELLADPPPIPVQFEDLETDDLPWKEESSRLMNAKLDPAVDSLARLVVLRGRTRERGVVLLLTHHALGDGRSVLRLVDDLLGYYDEAERKGGLEPASSLPIVRSPRAKASGSLLKRLVMMVHLYLHRRENRKANWTWLPRPDDPPSPHRLWAHDVFSEQDTIALARRCRKEKTTIYGALFAAATCALVALLPQRNARFKCRVPIDIRARLEGSAGPVTDEDLGNFIAGFEKIYETDTRPSFWPLARGVQRDVETFTAAGGPSLVYNLIRFVKLPFVPRTLRRGTMFVTSYGVVGVRDRYGSLSLEELGIVFKNDRVGPSLLVQGLVVQRRMNLSLSMVDVSEEFWERFRDEFLVQLRTAIGGTADRGITPVRSKGQDARPARLTAGQTLP